MNHILRDGFVNPQVNTANEELAELMEGFLSPAKLKQISGCEDLSHVTSLVLKVDTRLTSISSIGKSLSSLQQLKLNNSFIPSIRDLGSGYHNLTILWMARCSLDDVDSISSLTQLQELYLANNKIQDISSIGMLEFLEILDLEGNCVDDVEQVEQLALCGALVELTLQGNPIARGGVVNDELSDTEEETIREYRSMVGEAIPTLRILDDEELARNGESEASPAAYTSKLQQPKRPVTSFGRLSNIAFGAKEEEEEDFSSSLTMGDGDTMAGNPVLFLRSRRHKRSESANHDTGSLSKLFAELRTSVTQLPPAYSTIKQTSELVSITKLTNTKDLSVDDIDANRPLEPTVKIRSHHGRRINLKPRPTITVESIRQVEMGTGKISPVPPPILKPTGPPPPIFRRRREFVRNLKPLEIGTGNALSASVDNQ
ncbi:outer arm dynein light chain 1 [Rhizoclosmatium globosum]|uniref:Outer arm dynein light chain 1 n=1 Tax=Rhizoclosmatium globosum TaxID=329046 RepID=A0A1Y2CL39_9FUNG|nr:outer arm dynein light chain 1 [Rhizoclosmatium globosum]|eukprot:ORY47035.1 outer arm dynein light chain 1 [Rhizoclosmatium globosum]